MMLKIMSRFQELMTAITTLSLYNVMDSDKNWTKNLQKMSLTIFAEVDYHAEEFK